MPRRTDTRFMAHPGTGHAKDPAAAKTETGTETPRMADETGPEAKASADPDAAAELRRQAMHIADVRVDMADRDGATARETAGMRADMAAFHTDMAGFRTEFVERLAAQNERVLDRFAAQDVRIEGIVDRATSGSASAWACWRPSFPCSRTSCRQWCSWARPLQEARNLRRTRWKREP